MLTEYAQYKRRSADGNDDLLIEVNWNKQVTPCKKVKFTIAGVSVIIPYDDYFQSIFAFADKEKQSDLIPVTTEEIKVINRVISLRCKKDMKKGEFLTKVIPMTVTGTAYELLRKHSTRATPSTQSVESVMKI